jgi:Skp family chaperone for outer membrane proteins
MMKIVMATPARPGSEMMPAGLVEATVRSARLVAAGAGATAAGAVPATVTLLMEGALNTMFVTRIKFVVLVCGLIAGGAVVAAQQAGRRPEAPAPRLVNVRAAAPAAAESDDGEDDSVAVKQEMERLELSLLQDEVELLRQQVNNALGDKLRLETSSARQDPRSVEAAQAAYLTLRDLYLARAGELARRRRASSRAGESSKAGSKAEGKAAPGENDAKDRQADGWRPHASGAAVGSIDMDAVMKRYGRVRQVNERMNDARTEAKEQLTKLQTEVQAFVSRMRQLQPGSADYRAREEQLEGMKRRIERESDAFESEITRRHARQSASVLQDIHEVIAAVAKAQGLDYVVKVSPEPRPDANPDEVYGAMGRSVLYANPRNDITEEVIRELNRRFEAK